MNDINFIKQIYADANKKAYAIPAINFSTLELIHGIHAAAIKMNSPIIMSNSEGERKFFGVQESVAIYRVLKAKHPKTILHADHTRTFEGIKEAVDAGYPSVHFDGSELSYEENLKQTKQAADYAHKFGVFIEGELGGIKGGSTTHKESLKDVVKEEFLTKPEQAREFMQKTGVDSLAISVGNAHGLWAAQKILDFHRISMIKSATGANLVLHGGSGITANDFRTAIGCGINKININTEVRMAFEKAIIAGLQTRTDDIPYKYLGNVSAEVQKVVEEKMIIFKSEKKA